MASLFLSSGTGGRIPDPPSALAQNTKIRNSFIQRSLAGRLDALCTGQGAGQ